MAKPLSEQIAIAEKTADMLPNPDDHLAMRSVVKTLKWLEARQDVMRAVAKVKPEDIGQVLSLLRAIGGGVQVSRIINHPRG